MQHTKREEAKLILGFIGFIWLVFLIDVVLPVDLASFGLTPRTVFGLSGIVTMPFLHGGWNHIISNTVPLCVLLFLLAGSRSNSAAVVVSLIVAGGVLLWVVGRDGRTHVGASGLIYGLIAFLIVAGFRERRFVSLAVAVLTGFLFGGTLFYGVLPTNEPGVSWEGHLTGAIAGAMIGLRAVKPSISSEFKRADAMRS
ncbi:MAG: rhomboid family intramembrane serine protease [Planctomycetaceae bacterium]|jgi:membrane associated rhomboid family serine protease